MDFNVAHDIDFHRLKHQLKNSNETQFSLKEHALLHQSSSKSNLDNRDSHLHKI